MFVLLLRSWFYIICLNTSFYVTDAPNVEKAKLRICFLHFPDEMIKPYGQKRCLMDNAIPTLHLSNAIVADCTSSTGINTIAASESSEDIGDDSNFVPAEHVNVTTVPNIAISMANVRHFRNKIRLYRVLLHNQKHVIRRTRQHRVLHRKDEETWDNITANFPSIQRTFLDMIHHNFQHAAQVC